MAGPALVTAAQRAITLVRDPAIRAKALDLARKGANAVIPSDVPQLTKYVQSGPAPAAVVLGGFARAGVNPDSFFDDIIGAEADQRTRVVLESLRKQYRETQQLLDSESKIRDISSVEDRLHAQAVLVWARRQFGANAQAVREAHSFLRAFVAMDSKVLADELIVNQPLFRA